MRKGSITVFLSLVLVLLYSFIFTTLEAARIRGATAYTSMLTELAGDSFLASYYYPLFQNYRLFGVAKEPEEIEAQLGENIEYGITGLRGGMLKFQEPEVSVTAYETMLSEGETEFLSQIRKQVVLDGLSLALGELFFEEQFAEAGEVGEIYQEQEAALEITANVTKELLQLMELVDGICTGKNGIEFDRNGKMQRNSAFIKQFVMMEQGEIKAAFDNAEVFRTVSDGFFRVDREAVRIQNLLYEIQGLNNRMYWSEVQMWQYNQRLQELKEQEEQEEEEIKEEQLVLLREETEQVKEALAAEISYHNYLYVRQREVTMQASSAYGSLQNRLWEVRNLTEEAMEVVQRLEKKQALAAIAVTAYEKYLSGKKDVISEELYRLFLKELEKMKLYAGLEEGGFSVTLMKNSLQNNLSILNEISLSGFSEGNLSGAISEMAKIKERMKGYSVEGLWFSYGDIVVPETTGENVLGFLAELLTTEFLALVGIPKADQSAQRLDGTELPSAFLGNRAPLSELTECIKEVQQLFCKGGIGEALKTVGNSALDGVAVELYSMKYFHRYGAESPATRLSYEREYLVFGDPSDKANLRSMVLHLIAIRTLFCMVMILKQPERMELLDLLAAGTTGFTGMPVLGATVKYGLLLLWSVEEALVETAALLQGKRIAVVGTGRVEFTELFRMNKTMISRKAKEIPDLTGAAYQDYLVLLSLTRGTKEKVYRALDLIQENIRYRYKDEFRIRSLVTEISFETKTRLMPLYQENFFPKGAYETVCRKSFAY